MFPQTFRLVVNLVTQVLICCLAAVKKIYNNPHNCSALTELFTDFHLEVKCMTSYFHPNLFSDIIDLFHHFALHHDFIM